MAKINKRIVISINADIFVQYTTAGYDNIDNYIYDLLDLIKKLQDANKEMQNELAKNAKSGVNE